MNLKSMWLSHMKVVIIQLRKMMVENDCVVRSDCMKVVQKRYLEKVAV